MCTVSRLERHWLSVPKNRIANRCVFKSQVANRNSYRQFRRKIAEKSRNEIANRCVSKRKFQIVLGFVCKTARTGRRCPNFQIKNRRDFMGVRFRNAAFPRLRHRSVFGTLRTPACHVVPVSHTYNPPPPSILSFPILPFLPCPSFPSLSFLSFPVLPFLACPSFPCPSFLSFPVPPFLPCPSFPSLSFLSFPVLFLPRPSFPYLFFLLKKARRTTFPKKRIFYPYRNSKIPGMERKRFKKEGITCKRKTKQGISKTKERKDRLHSSWGQKRYHKETVLPNIWVNFFY